MASLSRFIQRAPLPAMAAGLLQHHWTTTSCDVEKKPVVSDDATKDILTAVKKTSSEGKAAETPSLTLPTTTTTTTATPLTEEKSPLEIAKETEQAQPSAPQKEVGVVVSGMQRDEPGVFHDLFPKRQLWQPKKPYPLWDDNWDGKKIKLSGDKEADKDRMRKIRKEGVTRHIILIRHGQYDETHQEDEKRILTEIGRKQADLTGQRIAEMIQGADEKFGPCNVKIMRVSGMARAKETADIIAKHIPNVERAEPDEIFNEGRPSHHIPVGKVSSSIIKKIDEQHPRIEEAFQKVFYRAPPPKGLGDDEDEEEEDWVKVEEQKEEEKLVPAPSTETSKDEKEEKKDGLEEGEVVKKTEEESSTPKVANKVNEHHEFEIVVCHANVLRYFLCRALQLPPEAWLRLCPFNCSLTYMTIRPSGTVSCRVLGDIGHLPYNLSTFSQHHGFNW